MNKKNNLLFIGANFVSHDSSVFGYCNDTVFAISEERFTRFKHDQIWPICSITALRRYYKKNGIKVEAIICGIPMKADEGKLVRDKYTLESIKRKVIGGKYLKEYLQRESAIWNGFGRYLALFRAIADGRIAWADFLMIVKSQLIKKHTAHWIKNHISKIYDNVDISIRFYDHHECHALSAFAASGFSNAIVVTMDGWGDGAFTKVYKCDSKEAKVIAVSSTVEAQTKHLDLPKHVLRTGIFDQLSIGHAYSIITWVLGFVPGADEGKVEALAAYSSPDIDLVNKFKRTVRIEGLSINIIPNEFIDVFHAASSHNLYREMNREVLCASIQRFVEDVYIDLINNILKTTSIKNLCLAGGVCANVILNMKIFSRLGVNLYIVPAMGDDGIAMGAAILAAADEGMLEKISLTLSTHQKMPYYGTSYDRNETLQFLELPHNLPIKWVWLGDAWPEECAKLISNSNKIGAVFHGRAEYGPRALGNRSIVADIRFKENTERINLLVKKRPGFQPFCPSFLEDERERLFSESYSNPHMTCAFIIKPEFHSELPCAVHVDGTSRVQFVSESDNFNFYRMLSEIKRITGFGGVINTSFNMHGRTICESPFDAITDFVDCDIDFLLLNGYLITRSDR